MQKFRVRSDRVNCLTRPEFSGRVGSGHGSRVKIRSSSNITAIKVVITAIKSSNYGYKGSNITAIKGSNITAIKGSSNIKVIKGSNITAIKVVILQIVIKN